MLDKIEFIELPDESMSEDSKPILTHSDLGSSESLYASPITATPNSPTSSRQARQTTVSGQRPHARSPISYNSLDDDGMELLTLREQLNSCNNSYIGPNNSLRNIPESTMASTSAPRKRSLICQTTIDFMTNCMKKMSEDEELELSAAVVAAYSAILAR